MGPAKAPPGGRFETLDGLRGVAALGVVAYHLGSRLGGPAIAPRGYVAVDFFFVLSGFVIAHAYEARLAGGLSTAGFLRLRLIRLLPLSALGVLAGLAYLSARALLFPALSDTPALVAAAAALNLFLLPSPFVTPVNGGELFPANGVLWSLLFEILANLAWVGLIAGRSTRRLALAAGAGAVLAAFAILTSTTGNPGWDWASFAGGAARVAFGFLTGVLIHRLRTQIPERAAAPFWVCALLLAAAMAAPIDDRRWDALAAVVLAPLIVVLGVGGDRRGMGGRPPRLLGELSYPLYALHLPILMAAAGAAKAAGLAPGAWALILVPVIVAVAWAALRLYDEPVRVAARRLARPEPAFAAS
jgi:peptidoglycan/LPS O-acetylase OafA/YrhL